MGSYPPARLVPLLDEYGPAVLCAVIEAACRDRWYQANRDRLRPEVIFGAGQLRRLLAAVPRMPEPAPAPAPRRSGPDTRPIQRVADDLRYHGAYPPEYLPGTALGHDTFCDRCMRRYPAIVGEDACAVPEPHPCRTGPVVVP